MPKVSLVVTHAVKAQVSRGNEGAKQIAVRRPSPELNIKSATDINRVPVKIFGVIELSVGDNSAIWAVHQAKGKQLDDFTDLYNLLARRPNTEITFQW